MRDLAIAALLIFGFSAGAGAEAILFGPVHGIDSARLMTYGGHTLTSTFTQDDAGWAAALSGSLGAFDAIVISHPYRFPTTLAAATQAAIAAYVAGGGRLIVGGDHGAREDDFLNDIFGYGTTVNLGCGSSQSSPIVLTGAAAGTSFAGAPTTVFDLSCTTSLAGTPASASVMYTGLGADVVWMDSFGAGIVGWYGWDFCCGSSSNIDDWYKVLDSALNFNPDSDDDGVNDNNDLCPGTAPGDAVDAVGCSDAQVDADGDGVCDPGAASNGPSVCVGEDACAATAIPEGVPSVKLGTNRWALMDGDFDFDTTPPKGKGPDRSYSTADTAGCSCEQIIEAQGLGNGHSKFGCSIGAMDNWVDLVSGP